jgi:hypothetical protein
MKMIIIDKKAEPEINKDELQPGDTFIDVDGDYFLVTDKEKVINLENGDTYGLYDITIKRLVTLSLKEK